LSGVDLKDAFNKGGGMGVGDKEKQGMSCERLERIERFVDDNYIATGKLAGALVQVWRGGGLALNSVLGLADRERQVPMAEDSIFRIYSMTKPITSVAVMMLVEECKISSVFMLGASWKASRRVRPPARCSWSICCAIPPV
jgi:CubicO group peptidase (beta-lactamase class C family)